MDKTGRLKVERGYQGGGREGFCWFYHEQSFHDMLLMHTCIHTKGQTDNEISSYLNYYTNTLGAGWLCGMDKDKDKDE